MKTQNKPIRSQLPQNRKSAHALFGSLTALAALLALLGGQPIATAQPVTDNFDDGDISDWSEWTLGGTAVSFPTVGTGKGLGMQVFPGAPILIRYPASVYTDFYMSVDLINWDQNTDGEPILIARGTDFGTYPSGYVVVYDPNTDGTAAGDRKGGSFEMYIVSNLASVPVAGATVTLEQGRSYRLVFTGVGALLTGQIYDSEDLTKPLVTIQFSDATYTSGPCGLVAYDDGSAGANITFDNYHSEAYNPLTLPVSAPATVAGLAGTPQVVSRVPASRFTNFHPPGSGISFATTNVGGDINAAATKLYLNDVDSLPLTASGPAGGPTFTYGGALAANTVYRGRIELQNVAGTIRSTNTFWFDTFSDAYLLTSPVKTVEAEDYNYSSGLYRNPIPVSGADSVATPIGVGSGYFDPSGSTPGTEGIDYYKPGGYYNLLLAEYRVGDKVQITQGAGGLINGDDEVSDILDEITTATDPYRINDTQRSQYLAAGTGGVLEYQVRMTSPGDWMNYTRIFPNQNYHVYLRCGSFGSTKAELELVGGDTTTTSQTTTPLGTFSIPNHLMRLNYAYEPLTAAGVPAVVNLSGTKTIRLTMGGTVNKDNRLVSMDYLLFVPTSDPITVLLASSSTVNGTYTEAVGASVNTGTQTITVPVSGSAQYYRVVAGSPVTINSISVSGGIVTITYTP